MEVDGKNVEGEQQLPAEKQERDHGHADGQNFAEGHAGASGLKPTGQQAENVERGKAEHRAPQHVIRADAADCDLKSQCREHGGLTEIWPRLAPEACPRYYMV